MNKLTLTLDEGDKMTLWAALCTFDPECGDDEHGRKMTAAYKARILGLQRRIHPELNWDNAPSADSGLNAGTEGAIHSGMIAARDRDRARLRIVLHLMGVGDAAVDEAEAKLKEAMRVHPEGSLTLTHGPFGESSATPETTFHNLIAMWWKDDDYGSQFNELLWERP